MFKLSDEKWFKLNQLAGAVMIFGTMVLLLMLAIVLVWMVVRLFIFYPLLALILVGILVAVLSIRAIYKKSIGE